MIRKDCGEKGGFGLTKRTFHAKLLSWQRFGLTQGGNGLVSHNETKQAKKQRSIFPFAHFVFLCWLCGKYSLRLCVKKALCIIS
jgi:hypothetical protein